MPKGPTQYRNAQSALNLATDNQRRYEPNFAHVNAIAAMTMTPGLVGAWSMAAGHWNTTRMITDVSGGGRHLQRRSQPTHSLNGLIPYVNFDGINDEAYHVATANFQILGNEASIAVAIQGVSIGGWFYFDDALPAADNEHLIGMWSTAAVADQAYRLVRRVAGALRFEIGTGAATFSVNTADLLAAGEWIFCGGAWDPGGSQFAYISTTTGVLVEAENATLVAAPLTTSTQPFTIGALMAGTDDRLDGRASHCWVAGSYMSKYQMEHVFHQQRALFGK